MQAVRSSLGCRPGGQTSQAVPAYPTAQAQVNVQVHADAKALAQAEVVWM